MLVQLGTKRDSLDVFDLLLDCHAKIRRFIAIAKQLSVTPSSNLADIRAAAAGIVRYFTQAFPLHVADEEDLVLPRVYGRDIDAALDRMRADHADHAALLGAFIALCTDVRESPRAPVPELVDIVLDLEAAIESHLVLEESTIFPALRALDESERQTLITAMRARRRM